MSKPAPTLTVKVMCDDCLKDVEFDYDEVDLVSRAEYQESVYGPENFNRLLDRLIEATDRQRALEEIIEEKDRIIDELTKGKP